MSIDNTPLQHKFAYGKKFRVTGNKFKYTQEITAK